ncbi:TetR/AcrR family transcriptional regulator [Brachybacterium sacelli]|uniref:TetR/AcrR family transcriptional repressor of nem operon n=1 Tax=Brachybacterium sacelli TaxID=173364 RepID=A0ABS4WZA3_9MICO|nr:TetR/AcrR family transcriptional regulator [Brachybacterium sacelli]MBP2381538.1 TetR/AcrR family transcriptional repressor of nem operon [Brachybacterium sacelli]
MARTAQFDRDAVLTSAMGAFWEHGYEGTSMAELLTATGLSKSSLYAGFGSKHDLFLAAYDRYRAQQGQALLADLGTAAAPEGIRRFFERIITGAPDEMQRFGCMSTNQAAELGAQDEDVRCRVGDDHQQIEDAFAQHLLQGQDDGTIRPDVDPRDAAAALVTSFSGFQLTIRAGMDRARLSRALDYLLAPLTAPGASGH